MLTAIQCSNGKVFQECGSPCIKNCQNANTVCNDQSCVDGCFCPPGSVEDNNQCIPADQCPCSNNGQLYSNGEVMQKDCNNWCVLFFVKDCKFVHFFLYFHYLCFFSQILQTLWACPSFHLTTLRVLLLLLLWLGFKACKIMHVIFSFLADSYEFLCLVCAAAVVTPE